MSSLKTQKQPQPKIVVDPKSSPGKVARMTNVVPAHDRIRERAYELYESRGRKPGQDEQDWLHAEREILDRKR
jgi:ABC-type tungstate transport system permease subunit